MENVLKYLYYSVGILVGIGLILGTLALLYFLIKAVYLDTKDARDYDELYKDFYQKCYDRDYKKLKDEYENKLNSKSREYYKEFYDEEMRKKENQNEST